MEGGRGRRGGKTQSERSEVRFSGLTSVLANTAATATMAGRRRLCFHGVAVLARFILRASSRFALSTRIRALTICDSFSAVLMLYTGSLRRQIRVFVCQERFRTIFS